jgi:hypothetical protein
LKKSDRDRDGKSIRLSEYQWEEYQSIRISDADHKLRTTNSVMGNEQINEHRQDAYGTGRGAMENGLRCHMG